MEDSSTDGADEEVRRIRKISSLKRENRRLRHSVSFQLGLHLTDSIRKPWKLLFLPLTFPVLCFNLGLQRLGRSSASKSNSMVDREIEPRTD